MIRWLVAKYIPNQTRREPVNVGIIMLDRQGQLHPRFLTGRAAWSVVESRDNFRAWTAYWTALCNESPSWERLLEETRPRSPVSYYLEVGGEVMITDRPEPEFPDFLFKSVVLRPQAPRAKPRMAEAIFERAGIEVRTGVVVEVIAPGGGSLIEPVYFDYEHRNGQPTYIRTVKLGQRPANWGLVQAALYGFTALENRVEKGPMGQPIALAERIANAPPAQLKVLERCCEVVDADHLVEAAAHLARRFTHPSGVKPDNSVGN